MPADQTTTCGDVFAARDRYREVARELIHELIEKADAEFPYGALAINLIAAALEKEHFHE